MVWRGALVFLVLAPAAAQTLGHSDPSFSQPSRAPGVDYVLPTEGEVKATLDRAGQESLSTGNESISVNSWFSPPMAQAKL